MDNTEIILIMIVRALPLIGSNQTWQSTKFKSQEEKNVDKPAF